jgi:hypothetical protein
MKLSDTKIVLPALLAGALLLTMPGMASAQGYPGNGNAGYNEGYGNRNQQTAISGVVTYFNRYDLRIRTGFGEMQVQLRQGTVINPTGANLRNGMIVSVAGWRGRDGVVRANRIDVQHGGWRR